MAFTLPSAAGPAPASTYKCPVPDARNPTSPIGQDARPLQSIPTNNRHGLWLGHTVSRGPAAPCARGDRQSGVEGKRVSIRVELGGRPIVKNKLSPELRTCKDKTTSS